MITPPSISQTANILKQQSLTSSGSSASFGLSNRDSASERISNAQAASQRVSDNKASLNAINSDSKSDVGLGDRNTAAERLQSTKSLNETVVQNHGFEAKMYIQNALTHNTKIINTPVLQRGSLLDMKI